MNLIKSSFYYILSDIIFSGVPILVLPFLSFYLLPASFGLYSNAIVLMNLTSLFISFSSSGFYGVNFYAKKQVLSRNDCFYSLVLINIINAFFIFVILTIFINPITSLLHLSKKDIYISFVAGFFMSINTLYLTKLRFYDKVYTFVSIRLTQALINVVLAILLVAYLHLSWRGRYFAQFFPVFMTFPVIFYFERKNFLKINLTIILSNLRKPLYFGLTLMPHALSSWIKIGLDRILLSNYASVAANGIYATGFQVSVVIALVGIGFNKAFSPIIYRKMKENDYLSIRKIVWGFLIINILISIVAILVLPIIFKLFFSDKYIKALSIMPYIIIGQGLLNVYIIISSFLFYNERTLTLSAISVISAVLHVSLLFLLLERYSELGAAWAFLFSSTFQTSATAYFAYKNYKKIKLHGQKRYKRGI